MIVATKLLILLPLLHQIASWPSSPTARAQAAGHPLTAKWSGSPDEALWDSSAGSAQEVASQHQNRRHHGRDLKGDRRAGRRRRRRHQLLSGLSIIDGTLGQKQDQLDLKEQAVNGFAHSQPTRIRRHRLASGAAVEQPPPHGGSGSGYAADKDRFWHNNRFHHTDWCSRDCQQQQQQQQQQTHHHHHANRSICASDGRLYKSMCELKRHSCRDNVRLTRRPRTFCPELAALDSLADTTTDLKIGASSTTSAPSDRVRIVELKKLCDAEQYNQMKLLLYREFNGNVRSMFRYYDADADDYIEAHELWPVANSDGRGSGIKGGGGGKLIYAQVWDNHTEKCPQHGPDDRGGDHSKCWYFLDFAFQPQYPQNPCSLSHLMLFDLKHPSHKFNYDNFAEAFSNFTNNNSNNGSSAAIDDGTNRLVKRTSRVIIGLGDDVDLKCRAAPSSLLTNNKKSVADEKNYVINDNDDNDGLDGDVDDDYLNPNVDKSNQRGDQSRCMWQRYNSNLAASKDPHISISEQWRKKERQQTNILVLHIKEAQLYLSGHFSCVCHFQELALDFEHTYHLQVLAKPRVKILPRYQWSLPESRISFECQYDQISTANSDTSDGFSSAGINPNGQRDTDPPSSAAAAAFFNHQAKPELRFGLAVEWYRQDRLLDPAKQHRERQIAPELRIQPSASDSLVDQLFEAASDLKVSSETLNDETALGNPQEDEDYRLRVCNTSSRASMSTAASKLTLENLQPCDSGLYTCRVELPQRSSLNPTEPIIGQDDGHLLVQDKSKDDGANLMVQPMGDDVDVSTLWILHENGISIYKIQNNDGQEMELMREINGHNPIEPEVEGNWNQLTLCGGLNSEQAVICEWSDNAVSISVDHHNDNIASDANHRQQRRRKYVYVGQPNLNRVVVFDSFKFEIVAVINTEPQPRRLHLFEPNKIHLSKWVKRRLSPIGNARWETAIGTRAHPVESTPQESRLYSSKSPSSSSSASNSTLDLQFLLGGSPVSRTIADQTTNSNVNSETIAGSNGRPRRWVASSRRSSGKAEPPLVQHDIWLLCYGRPLVGLDDPSDHIRRQRADQSSQQSAESSSTSDWPTLDDSSPAMEAAKPSLLSSSQPLDSIKPFEPRLSGRGGVVFAPFAWLPNIWSPSSSNGGNSGASNNHDNKEARLRNRKSVHIIQSTFLPISSRLTNDGSIHRHPDDGGVSVAQAQRLHQQQDNFTAVDEFKQSSVISTHHIYSGSGSSRSNQFHFGGASPASPSSASPLHRISFLAAGRRRYDPDLIQDLFVPQKPYSMEKNSDFKIHYAYVTHYDERRLFRVSMDNYRYDREIDLQDCDPIHMLTIAQGLIVVQCRAPISHSLIGQLVMDQLTASRIEFNANIKAQESYLSPDNRYLVSIFHNLTSSASSGETSPIPDRSNKGHRPGGSSSFEGKNNDNSSAASPQEQSSQTQRHSSIVYVQTVTLDGLRLQYELKTLFEISQCSFVWKDGYYAAIFVTTNRKDQQTEILSLRLIDSRLELMARVPGLVSATRHKEQLIVSLELRSAALSTNQGTFVIDLEENRVSQSLRRHLAPPTLLWV